MLARADAEQAGFDQMYCDLSVLDLHTWLHKCVTKDNHAMLEKLSPSLKLKASFAGFRLFLSTKQVFVTEERRGKGSNQREQGLVFYLQYVHAQCPQTGASQEKRERDPAESREQNNLVLVCTISSGLIGI